MSKIATSRRYVVFSAQQLAEWPSRSLSELDLAAVRIDRINLRSRDILMALGINARGAVKRPGFREGPLV
jgi:hypothetical protein